MKFGSLTIIPQGLGKSRINKKRFYFFGIRLTTCTSYLIYKKKQVMSYFIRINTLPMNPLISEAVNVNQKNARGESFLMVYLSALFIQRNWKRYQ